MTAVIATALATTAFMAVAKQTDGNCTADECRPTPSRVPMGMSLDGRDVCLQSDNFVSSADAESEVLRLINIERANRSLPMLGFSMLAAERAKRSAGIQAQQRRVGHPIGGPEISASGNNPEHVVRMWLNSPGHKRAMLNPNYTGAGAGNVGRFWSVQFSSDRAQYQAAQATYTPVNYRPQIGRAHV